MASGVVILLVIVVLLVGGALALALYGTSGFRDDSHEQHR
jgi:hypothetical protein